MFDRQRSTIASTDPEVWAAIEAENRRQEEHIELIASENYASPAVMAAQGCQMTNKYAEGYPGRRYYGGCENVDVVETLAIERIKQLYGAAYANVQANSGSQANQSVFFGLLQPGDTIMGMSLAEGGHLTHGMALNMSGKWFKVVSYGLDANEAIDYDAMERLAHEARPKLIIAGASAYSLHIDFERFARVAKAVGAVFMVDMAHYAGLIAAGVYPNPVPHADVVTSTTHKSLRGPRGGIVLMNDEAVAKKINSAIFPGIQGGPLMHVIAASLPRNPLPDAFVVEPTNAEPEALEIMRKETAGWPRVAHVQLDSAWVKRFDAFLRLGKLALWMLAGLFAAGLVAVTFNTIRLQVMAQSAEIEVARMIGATDGFIRRPFYYFGALQGALGGLLAAGLVVAALRLLAGPVGELAALYGGSFALQQPGGLAVAGLAALGAFLGWLGAQLSVSLSLRRFD